MVNIPEKVPYGVWEKLDQMNLPSFGSIIANLKDTSSAGSCWPYGLSRAKAKSLVHAPELFAFKLYSTNITNSEPLS